MSSFRPRQRRTRLSIERAAIAVIGALVTLLVGTPDVHGFGCQASGSLPIFPDNGTTCPTALEVGELVDITVTLQNTSSSIPPGTNVAAILVNACVAGVNNGAACTVDSECPAGTCGAAVSYALACTDTTCAVELPGVLLFVPVGGNGCVSNAAAVTGCVEDPGNSNRVTIFVNGAGIPLGAGASTTIATIRAVASAAVPFSPQNPCGVFGTRADTPFNGIVTTDDQCDADATGGAQGSSNLFLPQPTATPTPTVTPTPTETSTPTVTSTLTKTPTPTPTKVVTKTPTPTPTKVVTKTPTPTPTKVVTKTPTPTPTKVVTKTPTPTPTKVVTKTPTPTPTKVVTKTPTPTPTKVRTKTPTPTPTKVRTKTPTPTPTKVRTKTPTPTPTKVRTKTPTPVGTPGKEFCRSSSYWKAYAGTSKYKECSQNITQTVLDARGSLGICGELIKTTSVDDAASAIEAMCTDAPSGSKRQLARQLTAAALNCIVSDLKNGRDPKANPLCGSTSTAAIFAECNTVCAGGGTRPVSECIDILRCLNAGDSWKGSYCKDEDHGCDDTSLPRCDALPLPNCQRSPHDGCYSEHGESGSSGKCSDADDSDCDVIGTGEAACACDSDPAASENPPCP